MQRHQKIVQTLGFPIGKLQLILSDLGTVVRIHRDFLRGGEYPTSANREASRIEHAGDSGQRRNERLKCGRIAEYERDAISSLVISVSLRYVMTTGALSSSTQLSKRRVRARS